MLVFLTASTLMLAALAIVMTLAQSAHVARLSTQPGVSAGQRPYGKRLVDSLSMDVAGRLQAWREERRERARRLALLLALFAALLVGASMIAVVYGGGVTTRWLPSALGLVAAGYGIRAMSRSGFEAVASMVLEQERDVSDSRGRASRLLYTLYPQFSERLRLACDSVRYRVILQSGMVCVGAIALLVIGFSGTARAAPLTETGLVWGPALRCWIWAGLLLGAGAYGTCFWASGRVSR